MIYNPSDPFSTGYRDVQTRHPGKTGRQMEIVLHARILFVGLQLVSGTAKMKSIRRLIFLSRRFHQHRDRVVGTGRPVAFDRG